MKRIKSTLNQHLLIVWLSCFSLSINADPVLLFSDIESGPKNGWSTWQANRGAAVSIWGLGFGEDRGASFVTVNGTMLNATEDYAIWGEYWPTKYQQRITFWLNNNMADGDGEISVTVDGLESNPLPFTIRSGNIYFMTASNEGGDGTLANPFEADNSNYNWVDNMQAGDIYYLRDAQVYDGGYNGGKSVIWIRDSEPSGTSDSPIALLAFPGESPLFYVATYDVNHNRAFQLDNNYMVCSGFSIDSEWVGAKIGGDFNRFIGNDVVGLKNKYGSGTGIITCGNSFTHVGDGNKFLGNAVHGGNSQNRFDHAIYLSGCADNGGAEVGWNHFYDNDFGRGPIVVVNHQDDRCGEGQVMDAHFIFNNIIDCSAQRSRAIGISDLSYDDGEAAPEPTYVYNNVVIGCGTYDGTDLSNIGWAPAMYQSARGSTHFYNNTLYNSGYVGIDINERSTNASIKNNIIHMSTDVPGPTGNHYMQLDDESVISVANNLYYGLGDYSPCAGCISDQDNINNQDPLFVDAVNKDVNLQAGSPAIKQGSANLAFEVSPPSYAPIDRDINFVFRNGTPSIGAYEYELTSTSPINLLADDTGITLYPNPTNNRFHIQGALDNYFIRILDASGTVIQDLSTAESQLMIALGDIPNGLYFIQVMNKQKSQISIQKIVKF